MEKKALNVNGETIYIPAYYQRVDPMPGDPENATPFEVQTENARCIAFVSAESPAKAMPDDQKGLISGVRQFLAENQGLIRAEADKERAYTIVKNLQEAQGVQYILTYQKFCREFLVSIQAFFAEAGTTGLRESMIYSLCRNEGILGNEKNPLDGWTKDPYDDSITAGALMNLSEHEKFDERFPGFPLTMCRELVKCLAGEE
ncbi:MAG: hypothetical protein K6B72_03285 [Lachnospiraceae bacterium]|nr:hypothetical protein [Lachnospiraceae bacterium]